MPQLKLVLGVPDETSDASLSDLTDSVHQHTSSPNISNPSEWHWSEEDQTIDRLLASLRQYTPPETPLQAHMTSIADDAYATEQILEYKKKLSEANSWKNVGNLSEEEAQVLLASPTKKSQGRTYHYCLPQHTNRFELLRNTDDTDLSTVNQISNIEQNSNSNFYEITPTAKAALAQSKMKCPQANLPSLSHSILKSTTLNSTPSSMETDADTESSNRTQQTSHKPKENGQHKQHLLQSRHPTHIPTMHDSNHLMTPSEEIDIDLWDQEHSIEIPPKSTTNKTTQAEVFPEQQRKPSNPSPINAHIDTTYVPTDNMEIWNTTIEFPLQPQEVKTGYLKKIKERLTSFLPAVLAHTQGSILPWDETNTEFNPTKEVHLTCESTETLSNYFRYELIPKSNKIAGYMRIQVNARSKSIYLTKHILPLLLKHYKNIRSFGIKPTSPRW